MDSFWEDVILIRTKTFVSKDMFLKKKNYVWTDNPKVRNKKGESGLGRKGFTRKRVEQSR